MVKPLRILITGANGQVGFELKRALAPLGDVLAAGRNMMDLGDPESIRKTLDTFTPTIIVNPAAYTAVDQAEKDPDSAFAINAAAPRALARWAEQNNAMLIHYSTDYVFDGDKEGRYTEDDPTHPLSVYGASKHEGETAIREETGRHLILRTSWVVGAHGNNFLKTILRLAKDRDSLSIVADQFGAPTSAALLADVTAQLIGQWKYRTTADFPFGTYHLTASGETSWHGYARYVVGLAERAGIKLKLSQDKIKPIPTDGYPLPARRPANSRLDCAKLTQTFGLTLPDWTHGVAQVFEQITEK
ncbi:dTDP-4-dehydrorhamnose reductase [Paludibacterium paludis]|uniref:dTDP-4-dehydrorhamnose reductase n=1 Tax=Paludibacterium paludis TaxID=1225769 RepID=A0A918U7G9_9NEIS|nr:dTDP-4-dehydrorhamnose reductase [Paludibacterium paludis]GGY07263.1 NAD(P)-dependent oxidoreductase [Paludibacterium paludis]